MDAVVCAAIPGWFPPPHGLTAIRAVFGDIMVVGDRIIAPPKWEAANMTKATLPLCPKPLYVNRHIEPMLREALRMCEVLGGYAVKSIGCFAPRQKRSNNTLSLHSWGIAADINAVDNPPLRIRTPDDLKRRRYTIPAAWIAAFESVGFTWGGNFKSYFDPMHFQYASGF